MEIDRELLKGSISLLLLNLLSRGEMYGYEILQAAAVRTPLSLRRVRFTWHCNQVEKKCHIKAQWRTGDNGRERKYYSLTAKGRKAALEYERQWTHLTGAVKAVLEGK